MNGLWWLKIALGVLGTLLAGALAMRAIGTARWAERVRLQTYALNAIDVGSAQAVHAQGHRSSATRYDARAIVDLPAPVQRYFRAVLKDGQPVIAAARIEMTGRMNMSATAEQWKPFSSQQRVVTRGPGFL